MKTIYCLGLALNVFLPIISHAETTATQVIPPQCKIGSQPAETIIPSDDVHGDYWTNTLGNDIVLFTNTGGVSGRFQGFNLKTKVPIRLTTDIDPFPAPDGRHLYIHPDPITFYDFDSVQKEISAGKNPDDVTPNYTEKDESFTGYYESIATLESTNTTADNHSSYRILTGENEGTIKDYKVTFDASGALKEVHSTSTTVKLCPNMRGGDDGSGGELDFDTPILSPKGDEFAVNDRKTGTTVVVDFNAKTGDCKKVLDLGISTGKAHFSQDGTQIAFHSTNLANSLHPKPYVFDRKTNKLMSIEVGDANQDAQGTYPTFRPDGKIVYQRVYVDLNGKQSRDWVIVDPNKLQSIPMSLQTENACSTIAIDSKITDLEKLWVDTCTKNTGIQNGTLWRLTVTPADCKAFVAKAASNQTPKDREILASACPTVAPKRSSAAKFTTHGAVQTFPALIENRCVVCHVQGSPHGYIPFDDPEKMRSMGAIGGSSKPGQPFAGKTFMEQMREILAQNLGNHIPDAGIPRVPADGNRLNQSQETEILAWLTDGKKGEYIPPAALPVGDGTVAQ
jgi:hypothetical protein